MIRASNWICLAALLAAASSSSIAQAQPGNKQIEQGLEKTAEAFVAAFHRGDAKALSEFWLADGDYITEDGRHLKGRTAIAKAFKEFFDVSKGAKLNITILSLRVVKQDLAIEDGITEVFPGDGGPPNTTRYSLVHVKKDGQWKLASVRAAAYTPPSNYEHLRAVEWLIGDWVDEAKKGDVVRASFSWTDNQNFMIGSMVTTLKDIPISGATQWVGWDPVGKQVRSWSFATNGGFGQGAWSNAGKKWSVKTNSVLPDGTRITAINVINRIDADHLTWQSTNRTMNGRQIPDAKQVRMKRIK